ncbi:hypothetical protein BURMUCGD1_0050 [Burkholderia multivorans CGD1]|nr:hypothetical protein BURMUCGD1_0050 [Burkholderia multivorans CGD1]
MVMRSSRRSAQGRAAGDIDGRMVGVWRRRDAVESVAHDRTGEACVAGRGNLP